MGGCHHNFVSGIEDDRFVVGNLLALAIVFITNGNWLYRKIGLIFVPSDLVKITLDM
ncbi:MAG: hypothetical protein AAF378_11205 [Cyanobacteria bacterium P01_A01_bin.84]